MVMLLVVVMFIIMVTVLAMVMVKICHDNYHGHVQLFMFEEQYDYVY